MKCMAKTVRILAACAALVLVCAMPKPVSAGGIGADTIGLFPKEMVSRSAGTDDPRKVPAI